MNKGKLIVFEGADGSGKTTQSKLLVNYLSKHKIPNAYISFPRYETKWGKMVRKYLDGKFGDLDPYQISTFYANDRKAASSQIKKWIDEGKVVVANRYVWSNAAHMGAKFKNKNEREKYLKWLEKLEYGENKIPKEDFVILLFAPTSITKKWMDGRNLDIHERDLSYQGLVQYLYLGWTKKNWVRLDCKKKGKILSKEEVHKDVLEELRKRKMI